MSAVEISGDFCSRSACRTPIDNETAGIHRVTGLRYCIKCARRINEACRDVPRLVDWRTS